MASPKIVITMPDGKVLKLAQTHADHGQRSVSRRATGSSFVWEVLSAAEQFALSAAETALYKSGADPNKQARFEARATKLTHFDGSRVMNQTLVYERRRELAGQVVESHRGYGADKTPITYVPGQPATYGARGTSGTVTAAEASLRGAKGRFTSDKGYRQVVKNYLAYAKAAWAQLAREELKGGAYTDYISGATYTEGSDGFSISFEGWDCVAREHGWKPTAGGWDAGIGKYDGQKVDLRKVIPHGDKPYKRIPLRIEGTAKELTGFLEKAFQKQQLDRNAFQLPTTPAGRSGPKLTARKLSEIDYKNVQEAPSRSKKAAWVRSPFHQMVKVTPRASSPKGTISGLSFRMMAFNSANPTPEKVKETPSFRAYDYKDVNVRAKMKDKYLKELSQYKQHHAKRKAISQQRQNAWHSPGFKGAHVGYAVQQTYIAALQALFTLGDPMSSTEFYSYAKALLRSGNLPDLKNR